MRIKPNLNGALLYVCQISLTSRFQPKPSHFVSLHDTFRFCDYIYALGKKQSVETYRLTGSSDVMTREDLLLSGYPDPKGKVYLVVDIYSEIDARLKKTCLGFE